MKINGAMKGGNHMKAKIIAVLISVIVVALAAYALYANAPTVSAQGSSSLKVQPDEISVNVFIETKNATLQEAQQRNSEIRESITTKLLDMGVDESQIQYVNYNSYPWVEWENGKSKDKGFIVHQEMVIKVASFSKVPRIVDKIIESGGLISSISFELSQERQNEYKTEALELASKNAREKAAAIARGQDRKLGKLISLKNDEFAYQPYPYYAMKEGIASADSGIAARQAVAVIAPRELEVSASVSVEYKLSIF